MLKNKYTKKAFTLIELLVVITIIWILATIWINQFSKSLQKARDSKRISDISTLENAVVQASSDNQEFPKNTPSAFSWAVSAYIDKIPVDDKDWQSCNDSWSNGSWGSGSTDSRKLGYVYMAWPDENGVPLQAYEISTAFEAPSNIKNHAKKDNWNDNNRKEIWNVSRNMDTHLDEDQSCDGDAGSTNDKAIWLWKEHICVAN